MMKKLKTFSVSLLLSCLLVPCICCSLVVNALDPATIIELGVAAIELTVATANALKDNNQTQHEENVKAAIGALDNQLGTASVTVLNYAFFQGKTQMRYLSRDNVERSVNIDIGMYYLENITGSQYSDSAAPKVHDVDGNTYIANNIYFDIWYSDVTHYRIRYKPDDYMSLNSVFNYNAFPSSGDLYLRIMRPNNGRFFDVSDGSDYGTELTTWGNSSSYINFYYEQRNTIVFTPLGAYYNNQAHQYFFDNSADSELTLTNNIISGKYPCPKDICFNALKYTQYTSSGSASYLGRTPFYVGAFLDTNSRSLNTSFNNMSSSKKQCINYYYDNTVTGGTTIDNSNKTTVLNGVFANDFDLNGLFTGIADLSATIKPLLDLSLPDIESITYNKFSNMPDFNNDWGTGTDNDYYLLPWDNIPPTTGDINVLVTVEVERPLVTSIIYDDDVHLESFPVIATSTIPSYIQTNSGQMWTIVGNVFNNSEYIPIIGFLSMIGVAIAVLLKGA